MATIVYDILYAINFWSSQVLTTYTYNSFYIFLLIILVKLESYGHVLKGLNDNRSLFKKQTIKVIF